jgi:hypothetical protein
MNTSNTLRMHVVFKDKPNVPARHARVALLRQQADGECKWDVTDDKGMCEFKGLVSGDSYTFCYCHYTHGVNAVDITVPSVEGPESVQIQNTFYVDFAPSIHFAYERPDGGADTQPRVNGIVIADIRLPAMVDRHEQKISVEADRSWVKVDEVVDQNANDITFRKVIQNPGKETCKFWVHCGPLDRFPIHKHSHANNNGNFYNDDFPPGTVPPPRDHANVVRLIEHDLHPLQTLPMPVTGRLDVAKLRTGTAPTDLDVLFSYVHRSTEALSFDNYLDFTDALFCNSRLRRHEHHAESIGTKLGRTFKKHGALDDCWRGLSFVDVDAYRVLKAATEAFVMVNCGVLPPKLRYLHDGNDWPIDLFDNEEERAYIERRDLPGYTSFERAMHKYLESDESGTRMLPYLAIIRRKLPDVPIDKVEGWPDIDLCYGIIQRKLACPCMIELLWSYWHEEAMLVQTMNVLAQRFQNLRASGPFDPLANLAIDPLRPLNNLIWGYINDEIGRLTVARRGFEYDHEYGLRLEGRAMPDFAPADSRSRFLEAFHVLLRLCTTFYLQDDDTNIKADAFPVLNALKEVHLILSQGAHNQFGDLPTTARVEMLMQQWILARPEFREFLPTKLMVAYPEPWMDRVDAMKKLQGWTDTSVIHFYHLARFGEQLLLSIRYGNWSVLYEPNEAFNWARYWRPQVQGYIHAYRAVTGHDLSSKGRDPAVDGTLPSVLLGRRLAQQHQAAGTLLGAAHPLALRSAYAQHLGPAQPLSPGQQPLLTRPVRGNPS